MTSPDTLTQKRPASLAQAGQCADQCRASGQPGRAPAHGVKRIVTADPVGSSATGGWAHSPRYVLARNVPGVGREVLLMRMNTLGLLEAHFGHAARVGAGQNPVCHILANGG